MKKAAKSKKLSKLVEAHLDNGVAAVTPRSDAKLFEDRMCLARKSYAYGYKICNDKSTEHKRTVGFRYAMDIITNNSLEYNKAMRGVNSTQLTHSRV